MELWYGYTNESTDKENYTHFLYSQSHTNYSMWLYFLAVATTTSTVSMCCERKSSHIILIILGTVIRIVKSVQFVSTLKNISWVVDRLQLRHMYFCIVLSMEKHVRTIIIKTKTVKVPEMYYCNNCVSKCQLDLCSKTIALPKRHKGEDVAITQKTLV